MSGTLSRSAVLLGGGVVVQDSREERTFRVWLLSLLRNEVHIQNLTESLRDGYVLLRVLDTIAPGCVAWPSVHKPPFKPLLKQPKSIENCNQVWPHGLSNLPGQDTSVLFLVSCRCTLHPVSQYPCHRQKCVPAGAAQHRMCHIQQPTSLVAARSMPRFLTDMAVQDVAVSGQKRSWSGVLVQVVRIARQVLALPLVNIGGIDIVNGQHKLLLAILWQLMRYNIRGLLQVNSPSYILPLTVRCEVEGGTLCSLPLVAAAQQTGGFDVA